jgi:hypothetical protein
MSSNCHGSGLVQGMRGGVLASEVGWVYLYSAFRFRWRFLNYEFQSAELYWSIG